MASRPGRARQRLILLALTALTLLTVDLNGSGPAASLQRGVRDLLNPVASLVSTAVSPLGNAWNSVFNYADLEEENRALQDEVEALRGAALRGEADTETLRRLLEATDLPYVGDLETVTAEVLRGPVGNFDDHVITIDKGSRSGIAPGMAVVTKAGMVGRVLEADNATALVELISDPALFVGVRLVSTDAVGLGHAVPGEPGVFVVDQGIDWPDTDDPALLPEVGTAVVTAGESSYPAEIPLGRVDDVARGDDEVTMVIRVRLANDVEDLQFVSVVLQSAPAEFPVADEVPLPDAPLDPSAPPDSSGDAEPAGGGADPADPDATNGTADAGGGNG